MSDFESLLPQLEQWYRQVRFRPQYVGPGQMEDRVHQGQNCYLNDALLNCNSGHIHFADGSFVGLGVMVSTCTHKTDATGQERRAHPTEGRDIHIGKEVWLASKSIVLGPCRIGDYSVVAAGSVVLPGTYEGGVLLAGCPARVVRRLNIGENPAADFAPASQPRTLLITIDRAADRRVRSIDQLRAEGIDYEIVDGIDGKVSLPLERTGNRPMRNTELACYYSHLRACRRIVDYGWEHGLVLEDDFKLLEPGRLATVLHDLPPNCDYLALHRIFGVEDWQVIERGEKFNRLKRVGVCTTGIVLSQRFALHVLEKYAVPSQPIDFIYCDISQDKKDEWGCYELVRPLIGVTGAPSVIKG